MVTRAVAVGLVLLAGAAGAAGAPAAPATQRDALIVSGSLGPLAAGFGDPVTAEIRVLYDPERVEPRSVHLRTSFEPWREERRIERRELQGLVALTYTLHLTCHDIPCVRAGRQWQYDFPDARVRYRERGSERRKSLAWPPLEVSTRLPQGFQPPEEEGVNAPPVWRAAVDVPEPSFRTSPRRLQVALVALGLLLIVAAAALAAIALRAPRAPKEVPPLERALAQLGRARTAAERRSALEAVAAELHPALAAAARELAWSEQAPTEPAARELTERVREVTP